MSTSPLLEVEELTFHPGLSDSPPAEPELYSPSNPLQLVEYAGGRWTAITAQHLEVSAATRKREIFAVIDDHLQRVSFRRTGASCDPKVINILYLSYEILVNGRVIGTTTTIKQYH